jgi:dihydrofolate reductase
LKDVDWKSAKLASQSLEEEVLELRHQSGKDVYICSPSLIVALTKSKLIDEFQICVHPVITGSGLPLFKNISEKIMLQLLKTKTFSGGAVLFYYEPK